MDCFLVDEAVEEAGGEIAEYAVIAVIHTQENVVVTVEPVMRPT